MMKIEDYQYVITLNEDGFVASVGRKPKNQKEFDDWCGYIENGIEAQLDWGVLGDCAAEYFK
jgi:hypothetical protein